MKKLMLCVTYITHPGMREAFVKEVTSSGMLEMILSEDGCLGYEYYYAAQDANKLLLVEQWETEEKQTIHMGQPHMAKLKEIKEKYVIDTKLERLLKD